MLGPYADIEKKTQIPQNLEILAQFFSKNPLNEFALDLFLSPSDKNWPPKKNAGHQFGGGHFVHGMMQLSATCTAGFWCRMGKYWRHVP
jgi:hypothetical protein